MRREALMFWKRVLIIPFGWYRGEAPAAPPANEIWVGREKERALFLDRLLHGGGRGAYLITGQRGAGKSSFVDYCLREYRQAAHGRFLRARHGTLSWLDHLVILGTGGSLIGCGLVLSGILSMLANVATADTVVARIGVGLLTIPLLLPIWLAKDLLGVLFAWVGGRSRRPWPAGHGPRALAPVLATIIVAGGCIFVANSKWLLPILSGGNPVVVLCMLFLVAQIGARSGSQVAPRRYPDAAPARWSQWASWVNTLFAVLLVLMVTAVPSATTPLSLLCLSLALAVFPTSPPFDKVLRSRRTAYGVTSGVCLLFAVASIVLDHEAIWQGVARLGRASEGMILGAAFLSVVVGLLYSHSNRVANPTFHPPVTLLLLTRAVAMVWLGLYVAAPGLHVLVGSFDILPVAPLKLETDLRVLGLGTVAFWVFFVLEYDWIIRRYAPHVAEPSRQPYWPAEPNGSDRIAWRSRHLRLVEHTIPWTFFRTWFPVLVVRVNLGVEGLPFRWVVRSMLLGLRNEYYRTFLSPRSTLANVLRMFKVVVVVSVGAALAARVFEDPVLTTMPQARHSLTPAHEHNPYAAGPYAWRLLGSCATIDSCVVQLLKEFPGETTLNLLYFNFFQPSEREWKHVWDSPGGVPAPRLANEILPKAPYPGSAFRGYHLLILVILWTGWGFLRRYFPVLPYRYVLDEIDRQLLALDAKTQSSVVATLNAGKAVFGKTEQVSLEPVDPRTIEAAFLTVLARIAGGRELRIPASRSGGLRVPSPEVFFVFDELDKLATRDETSDSRANRFQYLQVLLADLKNMVSTAQAGFLFIGGRDLRDEWLADRTSRNPLLTSMFTTEVYLPLLLGDPPLDGASRRIHGWDARVLEWFQARRRASNHAWDLWLAQHYQPIWWPARRPVSAPTYAVRREEPDPPIKVHPVDAGHDIPVFPGGSRDGTQLETQLGDAEARSIQGELIALLSYRSGGNPKRLRELLEHLIVPLDRLSVSDLLARELNTNHVILLTEHTRFRMQLTAAVYGQIRRTFESRLADRDDKVVSALFYLSDFLLRFHDRAFSVVSLGQVEFGEAYHAPDMRGLLADLVASWEERYLHPIRNGLFDYRFRSDLALEIDHLSRLSPTDAAALNFTLDDSAVLRRRLEEAIKDMGTTCTPEALITLGEACELDQEFEVARQKYASALEHLDRQLVAESGLKEGALVAVARQDSVGMELVRRHTAWAGARLRLMLRIGLCHERERNLDRAELVYRDARTVARLMLRAWVDERGREADPWLTPDQIRGSRRPSLLDHALLLFQPTFAHAWVTEKMQGAAETGLSFIEDELHDLRRMLPFVRCGLFGQPTEDLDTPGFALLLADIYNRAADLYFYRGRGHSSKERVEGLGFLLMAHHHYAVALHLLRQYLVWRTVQSDRWNVWTDGKLSERPTLQAGDAPSHLLVLASTCLCDMAEAMIGRVSPNRLGPLKNLAASDVVKEVRSFLWEGQSSAMESWFGVPTASPQSSAAWFETPTASPGAKFLKFNEFHLDHDRLRVAVGLWLAGAQLLEDAGRFEDAGRERLHLADVLDHVRRWSQLSANRPPQEPFVDATLSALELARGSFDRAHRRPSQGDDLPQLYHAIRSSVLGESVDDQLRDHPFPLLVHLRNQMVRLELGGCGVDDARALHEAAQNMDAPFHLTAAQVGLALWRSSDDPQVRAWALLWMRRAVQMCTMGKSWQNAIRGLYVLQDDFNDRRRHTNHALQLFAFELVEEFLSQASAAATPTGP